MNSNKRARIEEQQYLFKNQNHGANLNNNRLSGKLCDVTIKISNKEFQAHKIILASSLKYFEQKFLNPYQKTNVIIMPNVRRETDLEAIITYAYTGQILLTESNLFNIYELADYLSEDIIKEACIYFLTTHLTKRNAWLAYDLSISVECPLLKDVAKKTIFSNFEDCSLTNYYLSLDLGSLKEILSCGSSDSLESQEILFEGVLRWILHDVDKRRTYINRLLELIDITKLKTDYLWQYFSKEIEDHKNDIVKNIMSFYHAKSQQIHQTESLRQSLMLIAKSCGNLQVQFYDFIEKKWSPVSDIGSVEKMSLEKVTIFNNIAYYASSKYSKEASLLDFNTFNPAIMETKILTPDIKPLLHDAALCAGSKMLYFCGGFTQNGSVSDQVVAYDPGRNLFETLLPMRIKRWDAAAIFYQGYLFVLGGHDGSSSLNSVEKYDVDMKTWTLVAPMYEARRGHAVAVLGGKLYACGGHESGSCEVYEPATNTWRQIASMNRKRQACLLVPYKGKLMAIGKDKTMTVEVYNPAKDHWQADDEVSSGLSILANSRFARGGLIPTSCVSNST